LEGQVEALRGQVRTVEAHNADIRAERDRALARIAELERQIAEQSLVVSGDTSLPDEILAAISADLEQHAPLQDAGVDESAAADEQLGAGQKATTDAVSAEQTAPSKERPWRWWRRILRRRTA
jgi:hypothetical protein